VNSGVVDGDKTVVLKEIEKLIEKPVWSVVDEADEMIDVIVMQESWAASTVLRPHDVAGGAPQTKDTKECTVREPNTCKDLFDREVTLLVQI
jgi:hypothetical protein